MIVGTQSQESESEVCAHKFYAAMRIKTHFDNTLYLSSLWSDLSCAAELVIAGAPAGLPDVKRQVESKSTMGTHRDYELVVTHVGHDQGAVSLV